MKPSFYQRHESAALFVATLVTYHLIGGNWWLFWLWIVVDVSCVGYLANPHVGAIAYNIGHAYSGPVALGLIGVLIVKPSGHLQAAHLIYELALIWISHIAFDRTMGYGLKFPDSFTHTHLGMIGKSK